MAYISLDKKQLINLEYALSMELLRSNRAGSYSSSTIINCNTRKYHGMLVTSQPALDGENHVLLSAVDETVIQREAEFNLGVHRFQGGVYYPRGHKYFADFVSEPIPKLTYQVGGVVLTKEMLFQENDDRMIIKYTLVDAHSPTLLRFKPLLAFRNIHRLTKANNDVDKKYEKVANGIRLRMYAGYSYLCLQFSKPVEYTHVPDWHYNFEYTKERDRGYECLEDLYMPGFFELEIKKGESVYLSAGLEEVNTQSLTRLFNNELKKRTPRDSFEHCLTNSAQQFIVKKGKKTEILAGFPWFDRLGRDTFISLPGLTLVTGNPKTFRAVVDTMISEMQGPFFPQNGQGANLNYRAADTPLWFFWALQQYIRFCGERELIWKDYGKVMKMILNTYRKGTDFGIRMLGNGLLHAGDGGPSVTWMDTFVAGKPVVPRTGLAVEINALWYNAMMFALDLAGSFGDKAFVKQWEPVAAGFPSEFKNAFWSKQMGYLADVVNGDNKDWSVRPNMLLATSLPYHPVSDKIRQLILEKVEKELLIPYGIRSLSPMSPDYKGVYFGDQAARDYAYYQGTAWPWLLCHFAEGYLEVDKYKLPFLRCLYLGFEKTIKSHAIGSISEVYDGDPPYRGGGAISMARSVAEILRMGRVLDQVENDDTIINAAIVNNDIKKL